MVPCGKCIGCKTDKSNEWASRCFHEAKMHTENCFLTLTYDDDHQPEGGTLVKDHVQKFIKDLRNSIYPKQVRYYLAGEYGEKLNRPHYHVLLFGYNFPDCELLLNNRKQGQQLFQSKMLSELWDKGFSTVGHFDLASAKYVAAYTAKKITGEKAPDHYQGRLPEFALMSKKPGIGHDWFLKHTSDVYPKDFFTIQGIRHRPPRYYDNLMEKKRPKTLEKVKTKRQESAKDGDIGGVERYYRANVKEVNKKQRERRMYENEQS